VLLRRDARHRVRPDQRAKPLGLALRLNTVNRLIIGAADKTNLLLELLDFSEPVTIIDPTGTFAKAAANILPAHLTERAIYFDPSDMSHPIGLNVLQNVPPDRRQPLTEQLCAYFEAMWPNGWGAQSNFILANCLRLLLDNNETLLGVLKLLSDISFNKSLVSTDPVVLRNWRTINGWDKKQRLAALAPLQNKIGTLLMSPMIRNIVGQPRTLFKDADYTIANLDRSQLGDTTARLIGGLLIARSTGPVVITDYGFFSSPIPFPQDRFTVSFNFLDQLPLNLRQEVLGIPSKFVFKTNRADAEVLSFYVGIPNPSMIMDMDDDQYRTKLGTLRTVKSKSLKRLKHLKRHTRASHTRPRAKVEAGIEKYLGD
jgi:hypothetical protein